MESETALPTCYRHPDRETRLACSSCERPICVECMRSASVGQKCPECAAPEGRSRVITADDIRRGQRRAPVSHTIIVVAVSVFALTFVLGRVEPLVQAIVYGLGAQDNALVAQGQYWRLITSMFLHSPAFIMHIAFNMYALYLFGPPLEREVGAAPFAALYLASGVGGGAFFYLLAPGGVAVGASGAIFGLFGAWLVASFRSRHTFQGRANLRTLLLLLGINAALPLFVGRIAWEAHLGGLIAGAVIAALWLRLGERPEASRQRLLIALSVAAALFGLVVVA
jgi:membrane associated rhomboid family serine protease